MREDKLVIAEAVPLVLAVPPGPYQTEWRAEEERRDDVRQSLRQAECDARPDYPAELLLREDLEVEDEEGDLHQAYGGEV